MEIINVLKREISCNLGNYETIFRSITKHPSDVVGCYLINFNWFRSPIAFISSMIIRVRIFLIFVDTIRCVFYWFLWSSTIMSTFDYTKRSSNQLSIRLKGLASFRGNRAAFLRSEDGFVIKILITKSSSVKICTSWTKTQLT